MKTIRSNLFAAFSIVLLLSQIPVTAMESAVPTNLIDADIAKVAAPVVTDVVAPAVDVIVTPAATEVAQELAAPVVDATKDIILPVTREVVAPANVLPEAGKVAAQNMAPVVLNEVKNDMAKSANFTSKVTEQIGKGYNAVVQAGKAAYEARPKTLAEAQQLAKDAATYVKETVQAHPYMSLGLGVAAATGAGFYINAKINKSRTLKAANSTLLTINKMINNDALTAAGAMSGKAFDRQLGRNLLAEIDALPASMKALKNALNKYGAAAKYFNAVQSKEVFNDLKTAYANVQKELKNVGFVAPVKKIARPAAPSVFARIYAHLPTEKQVAFAIPTALTAAGLAYLVYDKGLVGKAFEAVKNTDYAGLVAQANKSVVEPVINADYATMPSRATKYVMDHKLGFGAGLAGTALVGTAATVGRKEYKKHLANAKRQKALESAIATK